MAEEYSPFDYRTHYNEDKPKPPSISDQVKTRQRIIKERMDMHRMMSDYMSKALPSYKEPIPAPNDQDYILEGTADQDVDYDPFLLPLERSEKRKIHADIEIDDYPSVFREHQKTRYATDGDDRGKIPKTSHHRMLSTDPESNERFGIYTEGGVLFPPPQSVVTANQQKKSELSRIFQNSMANIDFVICFFFVSFEMSVTEDLGASNFLADILGFSRHERLDVKKPGPKTPLPLEDHPALNASGVANEMTKSNGIDIGLLPKIKKIMHLSGEIDDHAPHSVDTDYAHVIMKTP